VDYDAELQRYDPVLVPAWGVGVRDRVVDVGCGAGWTTREAARLAVGGSVLGVDVSAAAVERAREAARDEGVRNVAFECGDAQVYPFPEGGFDLAISRFGTMFFADPIAAFGNVGRALRPGGRLVMLVWQAREHNEWAVALDRVLDDEDDPGAGDAFSLGDPTTTTAILDAAGFADVAFADVRRPVYYGPDADTAVAWVRGFSSTKKALERLEPAADAVGRLRELMAEHRTGDGVWFDAGAWIVRASLRAGSGRAGS
jgi:SAM-dependent methyltransferase